MVGRSEDTILQDQEPTWEVPDGNSCREEGGSPEEDSRDIRMRNMESNDSAQWRIFCRNASKVLRGNCQISKGGQEQ